MLFATQLTYLSVILQRSFLSWPDDMTLRDIFLNALLLLLAGVVLLLVILWQHLWLLLPISLLMSRLWTRQPAQLPAVAPLLRLTQRLTHTVRQRHSRPTKQTA